MDVGGLSKVRGNRICRGAGCRQRQPYMIQQAGARFTARPGEGREDGWDA